jgi:hypothetical protein
MEASFAKKYATACLHDFTEKNTSKVKGRTGYCRLRHTVKQARARYTALLWKQFHEFEPRRRVQEQPGSHGACALATAHTALRPWVQSWQGSGWVGGW